MVFQVFRYIAAFNTLRKSLRNSGFTNTGFTDQYRVIFTLTAQDADDITDFRITADDRVEFMCFCHLNQILAILLQRVISVLRVVRRYRLVGTNLRDSLHEVFFGDAERLKDLACCLVCTANQAEEDPLHTDIFIFHLLGLGLSGV